MILAIAAASGFLAVALGAFGAHGLRQVLDAHQQDLYETAVRYHAWHSLALLAAGLSAQFFADRRLELAGWLFVAGILLFCGSLYGLALGAPRWLGPVTPVGGVAFLAGWAVLAVGFWRTGRR